MTAPVCRVPATDVGQARDNLHQIVDLYTHLLDQALHGAHNGHLEADRPYPTDPMTILAPVANLEAWAHQTATRIRANITGRDWITDDHDHDPDHPLLVLGFWDDMWRTLNRHLPPVTPTLAAYAGYLNQNMTHMAGEPRALFDEFSNDMARTRTHLESVLYAGERDEHGAPCLHCKAILVRQCDPPRPGHKVDQGGLRDTWACQRCTRIYNHAEYWNAVAAAYRANAPALTADDMHTELGVDKGTIRVWAHRGKIRKRGRDLAGRVLYDVADTRRAAQNGVISEPDTHAQSPATRLDPG
jgi:hypothetical protein